MGKNMDYIYYQNKRKLIIICLFVYVAIPFIATAQIIELDTLVINHITEIKKHDAWVEEFGEGPYINGRLVIKNNQNGNIKIGNSIAISYYHDGLLCNSLPYYTSDDNESIMNPTDSLILMFGIPLLFGTRKDNRVDKIQNGYKIKDYSCYIEELLESICVIININNHNVEIRPENIVVNDECVLLE